MAWFLQSAYLAPHLKIGGHTLPCRIYSSTLPRAWETAIYIQQAFEAVGRPWITPADDLREIHFGRFEGWEWSRVIEADPELYAADIEERANLQWPEGESRADFLRRILRGFDTILRAAAAPEMEHGIVVAVSHSGPVARFLAHAIAHDETQWRHYKVPKASITEVSFTASGAIYGYRIVFSAAESVSMACADHPQARNQNLMPASEP